MEKDHFIITGNKKDDHVTPLLCNLHWLPTEDPIIYKILLLAYKSLNEASPVYLKDLLTFYKPALNLIHTGYPKDQIDHV